MKKNENISNVMTNNITTVQQGQSLSEVRHKMVDSNVHHIPVLSGQQLVGMISFTDMMKLNVVINGADDRSVDAIIDQHFRQRDRLGPQLRAGQLGCFGCVAYRALSGPASRR